ncbi:DUF4392 domain-containing protein [Lutispora thermophila]|uniref:D-glutamate cyclase-like C-terminal domain-containing protein n=1 Tax=Lutispora thermophila DSM 19022 TaxID=1122184 RepID=A0A1M6H2G4_9FIRM|nr:DUF4392 domain-containing protein [Lutispora thermophila]SHJ16408.1 protein of unknown function [Lutispora thermophila DSM 19022]
MWEDCFKELERILKDNLEYRGLKNAFLEGELKKAAESLMEGDTVFIVTGFVIRDAAVGETDGPIGAVSLAGALKELGKEVIFITDIYSKNLLVKCAGARGICCPIKVIDHDVNRWFSLNLLKIYKPSHIISIERPGRAMDGKCYSMRGEDLSDIIPIMDPLFEEAARQGIKTIAIGDGGNEIGMGKIRGFVEDSVDKGKLICASFAADYLIVAGVSNWGAHALVASLSCLTGKSLLHDANTEIDMLKSIVEAGAVDGCTKKRAMTVDGLNLEENIKIFMALKDTVEKQFYQTRSELAPAKI